MFALVQLEKEKLFETKSSFFPMAPERLPREQYQICMIKTMREQKVSVKEKMWNKNKNHHESDEFSHKLGVVLWILFNLESMA